MGNQKEFIAQVEKLKKEFDFAFDLCTHINADRLKYLDEISVLKDILRLHRNEMKSLIQHAKECEQKYGISGDAVIESAEDVLKRWKV